MAGAFLADGLPWRRGEFDRRHWFGQCKAKRRQCGALQDTRVKMEGQHGIVGASFVWFHMTSSQPRGRTSCISACGSSHDFSGTEYSSQMLAKLYSSRTQIGIRPFDILGLRDPEDTPGIASYNLTVLNPLLADFFHQLVNGALLCIRCHGRSEGVSDLERTQRDLW
jgi:hypothetical protein